MSGRPLSVSIEPEGFKRKGRRVFVQESLTCQPDEPSAIHLHIYKTIMGPSQIPFKVVAQLAQRGVDAHFSHTQRKATGIMCKVSKKPETIAWNLVLLVGILSLKFPSPPTHTHTRTFTHSSHTLSIRHINLRELKFDLARIINLSMRHPSCSV